MEARFAHLVEAQPELLAEHFAEAGMIEKAIGYCLKAGLRSRDRFAHVEAINHLTKGLKMLEALEASPERDARELELLGPLGTAYIASRGYAAPEVGPIFHRARALCERVGQTPQLFTMMWGNFAFHIVRGDFRICSELADEAMAFGERFNDPGILMEALFLKGLTRLYRGDFAGARDCCARAIAEFDDRERTAFWAGLPGRGCRRHSSLLSGARFVAPRFSGPGARTQRRNGRACPRDQPTLQPRIRIASHGLALPALPAGNAGRRRPATSRSGSQRNRGFFSGMPQARFTLARGLLLQGRLEHGIRLLQKGWKPIEAPARNWPFPYYLSMLGRWLLAGGSIRRSARSLGRGARARGEERRAIPGSGVASAQGRIGSGGVRRSNAAEECFRRAVQTARRQQSKAWELRATTSLARLWRKQGRREEAFRALGAVHGGFTEGFAMPDLVDAAALLENLSDERMRAEFAAGIKYVRDCIPPPMDGLVSVDWRYLPASTLGGDTIGYHWVDDDHLALYLVDVTGHGLDAALLSVTVANVIRAGALPGADMKRPDQVLAKLNNAFQGAQHGQRFFTIWYGVYHCAEPHADLGRRRSSPLDCAASRRADPLLLPSSGLMMGVLEASNFQLSSCHLPAGARLLIFSDGVFEIFRDGSDAWNLDACISHLAALARQQGNRNLMDELLDHVYQLRGSPVLDDDFSIIEARFQ